MDFKPLHLEDMRAIKKLLADKPRDLLLFTISINNGLRIGDLLQLRVRDVQHLQPGESLSVKEQKTGKTNVLLVNKITHKALQEYLQSVKPKSSAYLFPSHKVKGKALTVSAANKIIKGWCAEINLHGNYGTHTLRKTFGYIQRVHLEIGFEVICKRFNHSNPAVTMRYLEIEDKEVNEILMNDI